jgi:hypothetical protein
MTEPTSAQELFKRVFEKSHAEMDPHPGVLPGLKVMVDRATGWKFAWQHSPLAARPQEVKDGVEDGTKVGGFAVARVVAPAAEPGQPRPTASIGIKRRLPIFREVCLATSWRTVISCFCQLISSHRGKVCVSLGTISNRWLSQSPARAANRA